MLSDWGWVVSQGCIHLEKCGEFRKDGIDSRCCCIADEQHQPGNQLPLIYFSYWPTDPPLYTSQWCTVMVSLLVSSLEEAANWATLAHLPPPTLFFFFCLVCFIHVSVLQPQGPSQTSLPTIQPQKPLPRSILDPSLEKRSVCEKASSKRTSAPSAPWLTADVDLIFVCCVFCKMSKRKTKKKEKKEKYLVNTLNIYFFMLNENSSAAIVTLAVVLNTDCTRLQPLITFCHLNWRNHCRTTNWLACTTTDAVNRCTLL